jgi:hypothetical protein
MDIPCSQSFTAAELRRYVQRRRSVLIVDAAEPAAADALGAGPMSSAARSATQDASRTAIYALADPRELRTVRYIGQTRSPERRYLQHVTTARLWLPDELPWWIASAKLRPLYTWLRELYRDDGRLPAMIVEQWVDTALARTAERARIAECLALRLPLLNFEARMCRRQGQLL